MNEAVKYAEYIKPSWAPPSWLFGPVWSVLYTIDILLGTLIWALVALYSFGLKLHIETGAPTYAWIIYANIPYLLWVLFATVLQLTITYLNR